MNSGYTVIQDISSTGELIEPFGVDQALPTSNFTKITVSLELESPIETSKEITKTTTLTSCNYLLNKNPCSTKTGALRSYNTTITHQGYAKVEINDPEKEDFIIGFPVNVKSTGVIPTGTKIQISLFLKQILQQKFAQYLKSYVQEKSAFEIDKMAADFIDRGLFEVARLRVQNHERGAAYYFTMGYIDEKNSNFSGANMYYQEGILNTNEKELFNQSIKRVNYLMQQ